MKNAKQYLLIYDIVMILLAVISVALVVADLANDIDISAPPYFFIDNTILVIFIIDYVVRFVHAKHKKDFFWHNIFDLLSIIPVTPAMYLFRSTRLLRILRILRILRLTRMVGLLGRISSNIQRLIKTNGLIYLIYVCGAILFISAGIYSWAEKVDYWRALWWAVVTTTTVGYGDISPTTALGKIAAVLLMFVGIGFIGALTSALTSFFENKEDRSKHVIKAMRKENRELKKELDCKRHP